MLPSASSDPQNGETSSTTKHLLAFCDQAIVSGTSFLTTIIVGRFSGPEELGTYTLGWALIPLILGIQWSLITMPYTFSCNTFSDRRRNQYNGSVCYHNLILAVVLSLLFIIGAIITSVALSESSLTTVFFVVAGILPFVLIRELDRRLKMARLDFLNVLMLDTVVSFVQLGCLLAAVFTGLISGVLALAIVGFSAAIGGLLFFYLSRRTFSFSKIFVYEDLFMNLAYGKWVFAARFFTHCGFALVPWSIATFLNSSATGLFSACYSVVFLINPFVLAVANVSAPSASLSLARGGIHDLRKQVWRTTLFVSFSTTILCLLVVGTGNYIVVFLFGSHFSPDRTTIVALAATLLSEAVAIGPTNGLFALKLMRFNFLANLIGAFGTILGLFLWLLPFGVVGASSAMACGAFVSASLKVLRFVYASANRI